MKELFHIIGNRLELSLILQNSTDKIAKYAQIERSTRRSIGVINSEYKKKISECEGACITYCSVSQACLFYLIFDV